MVKEGDEKMPERKLGDKLLDEYRDLIIKITKLNGFIEKSEKFKKLEEDEQKLLIWQRETMETYIRILGLRLGGLFKEVGE